MRWPVIRRTVVGTRRTLRRRIRIVAPADSVVAPADWVVAPVDWAVAPADWALCRRIRTLRWWIRCCAGGLGRCAGDWGRVSLLKLKPPLGAAGHARPELLAAPPEPLVAPPAPRAARRRRRRARAARAVSGTLNRRTSAGSARAHFMAVSRRCGRAGKHRFRAWFAAPAEYHVAQAASKSGGAADRRR